MAELPGINLDDLSPKERANLSSGKVCKTLRWTFRGKKPRDLMVAASQ